MKIGFQTEAKEGVHFPFQNSFNILQYVLNSTCHSNIHDTNKLIESSAYHKRNHRRHARFSFSFPIIAMHPSLSEFIVYTAHSITNGDCYSS
jgi:hypothetical protein